MPWWIALAHAAGTAPDDRLELSAESGLVTDAGAVGFGLGGGLREGGFVLLATAGVGARAELDGGPERPGYGLGSLAVGFDVRTSPVVRVGLVALADGVLLPTDEQDCSPRFGCRHEWFVGLEDPPALGVGFTPAGAVRVAVDLPTDAHASASLGLQPTFQDDEMLWYVHRFDAAVWSGRTPVSAHLWAGRYGAAVGLGYRLSGRSPAVPVAASRRRSARSSR